MSQYRIGTTYPPTDIESVLSTNQVTGRRDPRSKFYEAGQFMERLDGNVTAQGHALSVWTFDILTQAMVDALRVICPGFDADVYISTRDENGNHNDFKAKMIWPFRQMERRQFTGVYLGLAFEFRHLEIVELEVSKSEAVTVGESVATISMGPVTANQAVSVTDTVTDIIRDGTRDVSKSDSVTVTDTPTVTIPVAPDSIAGLDLWLDASDGSALYQDDGKVTPVSSDGDPVGAWEDASGNGYDFLQATSNLQPTYQTAEQNGLAVVEFDGSDILQDTAGTYQYGASATIFVISLASSAGLVLGGIASSYVPQITYISSNLYYVNGTDIKVIAAGPTGFNLVTVSQQNSTSLDIWFNGLSVFDGSPNETISGNYAYNLGGLSYYTGQIAEIVIYDSVLSDGDRRGVEAWLMDKWGLS